MADMSTLRSVLATEVENALTAVDSDYSGQVIQYYRPVVDRISSRRDLLDVMAVSGTIKYAEVIHASDTDESPFFTHIDAANEMTQIPQTFRVAVWRELSDADTLGSSSTSSWDALIWDSPDGLLHTLRTDPHTTSGGTDYFWDQPSVAEDAVLPLDHENDILAHYCEFTIELSD